MPPESDARTAELKARVDRDPTGRTFLALAEEYRKQGRLPESLATLKAGLAGNPGYLAARVALGRVQAELGNAVDAIAVFNQVLTQDRENLVAAKSLGELYLARGERVESIKKYKLYRALSGDRSVDDVIARLDRELAEEKLRAAAMPLLTPPPPAASLAAGQIEQAPFVLEEVVLERAATPSIPMGDSGPFDLASLSAALPEQPSAAGSLPASASVSPETLIPEPEFPAPVFPRPTGGEAAPPAVDESRTLADLYFAQGHCADAASIYERLLAKNPGDAELGERLAQARGRMARPAASPVGSKGELSRRAAKVQALKKWLAMVQAGSGTA